MATHGFLASDMLTSFVITAFVNAKNAARCRVYFNAKPRGKMPSLLNSRLILERMDLPVSQVIYEPRGSDTRLRKPRFLYFDLGNVLLYFDHMQACRQIAALAEIDPQQVWDLVFDSGMELRFEAGEVSTDEFYDHFCRQTKTRPEFAALTHAASSIFRVNGGMKAVLGQLLAARHRLGLLSNTNEIHWRHVADGRYSLLPEAFEVLVLSYEVKAVKPDPKIFRIAAEMAGVAPEDIFYTDDVPGHVAAARTAGFDAVQYTTTPALVNELRARGVEFNY